MSKLQDSVNSLFHSFSNNRQQSIEEMWRDAYNVFNRIVDSSKSGKKGEGENWRSDAFLGTTRQKIVAAAAILTDTMLQGGRINYFLETSAIAKEALEEADFPEDFYEDNKEKMTALIDTQLGWAGADLQLRKGILSGALYGDAYARLILDEHTKTYFRQIQDTVLAEAPDALRFELQKDIMTYPKWEHLSIWDCFTDLEDKNPRTNLGFFHRSFTRKAELKKLLRINDEGVIPKNLKKVLESSDTDSIDSSTTTSPKYDSINTTLHNLRTLDFYGRVKSGELKSFLTHHLPTMLDSFDFPEDGEDEIEAHLLLAGTGNEIVRVSAVDEALGRPIFWTPWEDDTEDAVKSTGVADNCMNTQHLLNSTFRALIDNQVLSGNALLGVKEEHLMEKIDEITPGKKIRLSPECPDVRQALQNFQIQDVSPGLIQVFGVIGQMLEEDSNIPRVQQGIEASREETAFSMSQRLEKSGKYFGQVVRNYDDGFIEQMIQYIYHYNMLDPEVTVGKGDYEVQALGFSSFQDKVTRLNGLRQFFEIALSHPELFEKLKLESLFREFARMLDLDPEQVTYSEDEIAQQKQQEAVEMQAAMEDAQLDKEAKEATTSRDKALAAESLSRTQKMAEDTKMDQLKTIDELTNKQEQTQ